MRSGRRLRAAFPSLERLLRKLSLRAQVAILLAVAMLPVGIFAAAQGFNNYYETKQLRREAFALGALEASQEEQAAILEAFGALSALDTQLDLDAPTSECRDTLGAFIAEVPTVPFIGFIQESGLMTCSHPEVKPRDFSKQLGFRTFLESPRRSVSAQAKGEISGQQVIVITRPVYRAGKLRGALSMSISSRYLEWVARTTDLPAGARFAIVTAGGVGVAQSRGADDFEWMPSTSLLRSYLQGPDRLIDLASRQGEDRVYAIAPLFERDIFAIASWPGDAVPSTISARNLLTISLPMLMWALAVGVAYFAVDQLALRHILYLDRLVTAYGKSGRPLRAQRMRDAPTEIAQLGASFDEMADGIETRENALHDTVEEKETLLREINHRVKNNLQLISSLMNLQIRDAEGPRERIGLERLQERIHGLSLVHQKIYESERTNAVRLDRLIEEISSSLRDGSARTHESVKLTHDLDPVTVSPDMAVPMVLFATEAIVNTFKHALSHVDYGRLDISLKDDEDSLRLRVANSTHLVKTPVEPAGKRGIGQQLIEGFARQLRGEVIRNKTDDTFTIELIIPREKITKPDVEAA